MAPTRRQLGRGQQRGLLVLCTGLFVLCTCPLSAQNVPMPQKMIAAVFQGDPGRVSELLLRGYDPNAGGRQEEAPLVLAVRLGHVDVAGVLLDAGAHADVSDSQGLSPLMYAVLQGRPDVLNMLLAAGADPNFVSDAVMSDNSTAASIPVSALSLAVARGEWELFWRLYRQGGNPVYIRYETDPAPDPLSLPSVPVPLSQRMWGDLGRIRDQVQSPDWDADPARWILHVAARDNDWFLANRLLRDGFDPGSTDSEGVSPLMLAAWYGHTALAELLVSRGARPLQSDTKGWNALAYAAAGGQTDTLAALLQQVSQSSPAPGSASTDTAPETTGDPSRPALRQSPLYFALTGGTVDMIRLLLDAGWPAQGADDDGTSLLMMAAWLSDTPAVTALLPLSSVSARDNAGRSALEWSLAAFERDRKTGRETGARFRASRNYPIMRLLAGWTRNPGNFDPQPSPLVDPVVSRSWIQGRDPAGADRFRTLRPPPVPQTPGDGDLTLLRIIRDEEPGEPAQQ